MLTQEQLIKARDALPEPHGKNQGDYALQFWFDANHDFIRNLINNALEQDQFVDANKMVYEKNLPDEIELGLFYAPAPMSEYYTSVIDFETKATPIMTRFYVAKDRKETK